MNKKAIVTHPATLFFVGVIVGIILILLVINKVINIPIKICP